MYSIQGQIPARVRAVLRVWVVVRVRVKMRVMGRVKVCITANAK